MTDNVVAPELPDGGERYRVEAFLGEGTVARVYRAYDRQLERPVALKLLRSRDRAEIERLQREARAQASLEHEHTCRVFEVGEVNGRAYIAMQLVDGDTLWAMAPLLGLDDKVRLVEQAARAVQAAHAAGVVHRDLNPGNIMVEARPGGALHAYVVDFGLAGARGSKVDHDRVVAAGAPAFTAPERLRGEAAGSSVGVDVYGLGATLYAVLAEQAPFYGATPEETARQVSNTEPLRLSLVAPGTPVDLETITEAAMAKDPARRYPSARRLADDLRRWRDGEPISVLRTDPTIRLRPWLRAKRTTGVLAAAVALATVGAVAATVWLHTRDLRRRELIREHRHRVERMDTTLRRARMLPVHDTRGAEGAVRRELAEVEASLMEYGALALGSAYSALGFGHLVLREFEAAEGWFEAAMAAGADGARIETALGIARAMRILNPAGGVGKSRPSVEATVANLSRRDATTAERDLFHRALALGVSGRLDDAVAAARESAVWAPWLYEALHLEGDLLIVRAERLMREGGVEPAVAELERAGNAYARGLAVARSDGWLHEAEARRLVRLVELLGVGNDRAPEMIERAARIADRAALIRPDRMPPLLLTARVAELRAELAAAGGGDPAEARAEALQALERAAALDPENVEVSALRDRIETGFSESSVPTAR